MQRRNFLQLLGISTALAAGTAVAVAAPVSQKRRLFHSVQSGHWDDPLTWDVGEVPTPGSNVLILGHSVTVARTPDIATLNCIGMSNIEADKSVVDLESFNNAWMEFMDRGRYAT
jgi:hypothetical protein